LRYKLATREERINGQGQWPGGRYRRQREYPQPPPPSKNNTTITINRVSIVSPLFGFSILNSVGARYVPELVVRKRLSFPTASFGLWRDKDESTVAYVESLDQKVEFD
jgi:hypothetical protein